MITPTDLAPPQQLIASFPTYRGAEGLADELLHRGSPVEHIRIVGTGLRTVEYVDLDQAALRVSELR